MISARCYYDIYVKISRLPFTSLYKKRLSIESSPPDPPSAHDRVLVGTHVPMDTHCERKEDRVEQKAVRHL
jgi:hypothetical protein